jgi:ABC-type polysaccharide/polyol phosphate transport system ATPase subunit
VKAALNEISFKAKVGDRIGIVGKNGSGKSTLCRLISRIYEPENGQIIVKGSVQSILDPSAIIFPELSGYRNAEILMQLFYKNGYSKVRLDEALNFSGLGKHLSLPFRTYSNGMKTRLILSIATARPADIFILDEIFDGADAEFQSKMNNRMVSLIERSNIVFFVSHSEDYIRRVCNRGLLIHEGRLLYDGNIDKLFQLYEDLVS